ncbi:HNH endonuclease [Pectobacterium versatile]|uniref:HNH endonuclease n=1 Tax=Pectobacterium versatile TaxID=2488639 RepID=UPI001937EBE5|nr:HNH endonuclease [Pectobacterium versatile]QQK70522.1 HNH endonuclease [Pectobacterium versatile]
MGIYNTASDSANTAVRVFLTKVGEFYLGHSFNTGSGKGKVIWLSIKDEYFSSSCAYCGEESRHLQVEHIVMFNRTEYGLHHPGNVVPCCKSCNTRFKNNDNMYCSWEEHLLKVCQKRNEIEQFEFRKKKIFDNFKIFKSPQLNDKERHAIRVVANSLYENIKTESEKSLNLYKQLDKAFVK